MSDALDFEQAMAAVEELVGSDVEASVVGLDEDDFDIAMLAGTLIGGAGEDSPEAAETAVTFFFDDNWRNSVDFWPSRFVSAERIDGGRRISIRTLDGVVLIGPASRPWID
jgi:hypothetical protein